MQFIYTMGMTLRRVKRVKRSKKYGRRKTSRRRYTRIQRIQRGGEMHEVCKSTGFFKKSGITIQYDDETQMYTIGSKPYAQLSDRYKKLKQMYPLGTLPMNDAGYIILTQPQFNEFVKIYCSVESTDKQCDLIRGFSPPAAASPASPASAAATSGDSETEKIASLDARIPNQLKINETHIAYMNHAGIVKGFKVDKSKTKYNFDNFTIPLSDGSVITGNLNVQFVFNDDTGQVTTNFTLELNAGASNLIDCMRQLIDKSFVGANITSIESRGVFSKTLIMNGDVTENRVFHRNLSMYDFSYLIREFAKQYQSCSDPAQQMADLRISGPQDVARVIESKFAMLTQRLSKMSSEEQTRFEALKQQFKTADRTTLELLNKKLDEFADARRARLYPAAGGKTIRKNRNRR